MPDQSFFDCSGAEIDQHHDDADQYDDPSAMSI